MRCSLRHQPTSSTSISASLRRGGEREEGEEERRRTARSGLAREDGETRDDALALFGRHLLELEVAEDDTEDVEELPLCEEEKRRMGGERVWNRGGGARGRKRRGGGENGQN